MIVAFVTMTKRNMEKQLMKYLLYRKNYQMLVLIKLFMANEFVGEIFEQLKKLGYQ